MESTQNLHMAAKAQPEIIPQPKLSDRLADVLRRALISTGGKGGAIALMQRGVMMTCARAGCAPELGSHVNLDDSLAGLCLRGGRTVRSHHLDHDTRVQAEAWRGRNAASMVVTPLRKGDAIVGVLAVYSDQPQAFSPNHCAALEILSLALDVVPAQQRPPSNHNPAPPPVRFVPAKERAPEPPAPLPAPPRAPDTTAIRLAAAAATPHRSPIAASLPSAAAAKNVAPPHILRFHKSERMLHWSIAVPFLVCFTSALILVIFYNPHPQRAYRMVFSMLHRISGACLMFFPALTALRNRGDHRVHVRNIKEAFTWVTDDVKWLFLMFAAALSSKVSLPEQGKFNAAEKLNFMMVLCFYPLFLATGVVLCGLHFPVAAWMLHVAMAAMAAPLMLGHIFMATINPSSRVGLSGMLTGYVDRHWAQHHYTRWYREQFEGGHARGSHGGAHPTRPQPPLVQWPSEAEG